MTTSTKIVNGYRVQQVDFGAGGAKLGAYFQTGPNAWKETDLQGHPTFNFVESRRDEWSVYLDDPSRQVNLQIDLHTMKIRYSDPNTPIRDQYDVLSAAAVNGLMAEEASFGSLDGSGDMLGAYLQTGPSAWKEIDTQGHTTFEFKESNRDDWSVYLIDQSREVSIQIDIWTKKIFYSDPKAPRREQYTVLFVEPVDGLLVEEAVFGDGANTLGSFRQVEGTKNWQELNKDGVLTFNFVENNRDDWSVYLTDASRNVSIQVDIWTNKIVYSDPNTPPRDQYDLLYAKS